MLHFLRKLSLKHDLASAPCLQFATDKVFILSCKYSQLLIKLDRSFTTYFKFSRPKMAKKISAALLY